MTRKSQDRQKKNYDTKVKGACLQPKDRVLVKIVAFEGRHKIADKWEEDVYIIIGQPNHEIPVFKVRKENGTGRVRTLHRNLLLPVGSVESDMDQPQPMKPPRRKRQLPKLLVQEPINRPDPTPVQDDTDAEDSEPDIHIVIRERPAGRIGDTPNNTADAEPRTVDEVPVPNESQSQSGSAPDSATDRTESNLEDIGETHSVIPEQSGNESDLHLGSALETSNLENSSVNPEPTNGTAPENSPSSIRKSTRQKSKPAWMTRGDFVCNAQNPDWMLRADYLRGLVSEMYYKE